MSTHREGTGLGIGSLVIGAVAGAIAGILFAPRSGKETRDNLLETLTSVKDEVAAKVADLNLVELTQQAYQTVVATVVQTYEDAKKLTADEASTIKADLERGYEDIKQAAARANTTTVN